jgi:hypothetical protein
MNIIERNFYRLLRAGAFGTEEQIEPLSTWKWNRLYQLSEMHDVAPLLYKGIERCHDQFFLQIPGELLQHWSQAQCHGTDDENDMLAPDHLTNPLLDHKLQNILDQEDSNTETRTALLHLLGTSRFIMNAGIPVKRIAELGVFIRQNSRIIDYDKLKHWIEDLKLTSMAQLMAAMMVKLLAFEPDELPFMQQVTDEQIEKQIRDMFRQKNSHAEEWYFSQGKDIFVHTSNSSAMLWSVRRSAKYFRYYPAETLTNFVTSFAHSLSHIEE